MGSAVVSGVDVDVPLQVLFERQVRRSPGAVAVVCGGVELTYAGLNGQANRVARFLRERGVAAGAVVAVQAPRDLGLVAGLLGVLKAGAGYTLLDPEWPAARRDQAVADAGASVLLSAELIGGALAGGGAADDADVRVGPDAVACVMFTSGSTGRPKGVVAPHRALVATYAGQDYADFDDRQVWLQCSPVSWDAFGLELFGALLFGGVCVLHPGQRPDPETVARLVARYGVTQLQVSASLFNFLVDEFPQVFEGLRVVFTGGERASPGHVARLAARCPGLRVVNGYGPVESLGFTTCHLVVQADLDGSALPIGRPVAHKGVHVLDGKLQPAAAGTAGEIYATGAGLAYGYAGQPGMTAQRFVPDPLGAPGSRMYRTGDVGGWHADGSLQIAGRVDDQVKIRGFRVEPGEVAAALARCAGVRDCAVVAHEPAPGEPQLAAYVTSGAAAPPGYAGIRAHLARLVPDYMIPSSLTVLDALPLTANGKLDRAALPPPTPHDQPGTIGPGQPGTGLMAQIAEVWSQVLGVGSVAAQDDFFQLGGHSLAALRALYILRDRLSVHIPLPSLMDSRDLTDFTAMVQELLRDGAPVRSVPALRGRRGTR